MGSAFFFSVPGINANKFIMNDEPNHYLSEKAPKRKGGWLKKKRKEKKLQKKFEPFLLSRMKQAH